MQASRSHQILISGIASSLLGALVMLSWHFNLLFLIQTQSGFVPMMYNTAFCFLVSGLGLILGKFSKERLGSLSGALVVVVAGLTLFEYFLGANLGIDEFIVKDYVNVKASHPGRMAPNTALSFLLFGISLLCWTRRNYSSRYIVCSGILGSIILALAVVALYGYITGLESAYGWGDLTRMAIHTSMGFMFLSLGIILLAWEGCGEEKGISIPSWFSGVIFIGGVTVTILLWQAHVVDKRQDIEGKFKLKVERLKSLLLTELNSQSLALARMGRRWEVSGSLPEKEWKADAENYLNHNSGYQAIALGDSSYKPKWMVFNKNIENNQESFPWEQNSNLMESLKKAKNIKSITASSIINLKKDERGFSVNIPILIEGKFSGFVLGIFHVEKLMQKILDAGQFPNIIVSLFEGKDNFYQSRKGSEQIPLEWGCEAGLNFHNISWKIRIWPTLAWLNEEKSHISNAGLVQGILMTFLLSLATQLYRKEKIQKNNAKSLHKKNLQEMGARYRAQKSLSVSENRFKTLVEKMNDGLVTQDKNGIVNFVNDKFCAMFGYSQEEVIGKSLSYFIPNEIEKNGQKPITLDGYGNRKTYQSTGTNKDKKPIHLIISPEIIVDSSGQNIGSFCVITDITELKVIQKDLMRQKEELDIILNSVPAMIWYKDKNNKILRVNKSAAESIGLSVEKIEGKFVSELYPEDANQYHADDLEVIGTGKPKFGIIENYRAKNNVKRWIHTDKIPYLDENGEVKGVIVFSVDITDQKKAEDELNKYKVHLELIIKQRQKELVHSESRFRQVIVDAPIPIMVHDDTGEVVMLSRRWTELSGYSHNEIPTIENWVKKAYGKEQAVQIQQVISNIFESNQLYHEGEFEITASDGEKRMWDFFSKPFTDLVENRKYAVSMAVDISDRKIAEQLLIKSQEQLVHAEKLNATGKLSASIAHEFNNPIYGIRNVLEKLIDDVPMDDIYRGFVDLAIKECNRVTNLIQKLHDFHRPSSSVLENLDIHKVIDETLVWVQQSLKEKKIILKKEFAKDLPKVEGVSDQIKQVILNLLQNAEEAIPNGNGRILINTQAISSKIKIRIQDTGVGVKKENLDKIFDPFFTTKSTVKGTGLGLSVSYGIIKSHGGDIEVNGQLEQGTEFIITLPLKKVSK